MRAMIAVVIVYSCRYVASSAAVANLRLRGTVDAPRVDSEEYGTVLAARPCNGPARRELSQY